MFLVQSTKEVNDPIPWQTQMDSAVFGNNYQVGNIGSRSFTKGQGNFFSKKIVTFNMIRDVWVVNSTFSLLSYADICLQVREL